MRTAGRVICHLLVLACVAGLSGCGKKADENKPIEQVTAEAEQMSTKDLRSMAEAYHAKIVAKQAELDQFVKKLAEIPALEQLGKEAGAIKSDMDNLSKAISALTERFKIYYDKLKDKGGDLSGLELGT